MKELTVKQLKTKVAALGNITDNQRNDIICSLIGHSRIQEQCFGYYNCGRCGQQLGDTLGGSYPFAAKTVVRGHNCDTCQANFKECTWRDKLFVRDPFKDDFLKDTKADYLLTF